MNLTMSKKNTKEKNANKGGFSAEMEINILPLLGYLVKKIFIIILVGVITGTLAFFATKIFVHPTYRCSFTAYVNNKQSAATSDLLTSSDVSAAKQLVLTYSKIIKSNTILSAATEEMDLGYSVKQLKGMVTTEIQDETEIIQVYVVARSPEESYKIANAIGKVSPKIMADIVEGSSMKIVEYPQIPDHIFKPSYVKYTLLGFVAGAVLTILLLIIQFLRNDTITNEADIEARFSVPVLGVLPDVYNQGGGKSGYYYEYYYEKKDDKKDDKGDQNSEKA